MPLPERTRCKRCQHHVYHPDARGECGECAQDRAEARRFNAFCVGAAAVGLALVIAMCLQSCTIGYSCRRELHRAPPPDAFPYYLENACRRLVCASAVRLPSNATETGRCE